MKNHKNLEVWKISIALVKIIYRLSDKFPSSENFGIKLQIRRAAVSVPSNIAEGAARKGKKEFEHFLYIALASLIELDTQLTIAFELGYINKTDLSSVPIERLTKLIHGTIRYLKKNKINS